MVEGDGSRGESYEERPSKRSPRRQREERREDSGFEERRERGDQQEREEGREARDDSHDRGGREGRNPAVPEGKRRVFIGLGKLENVRPGELAGMLYNEAGAPDGVIGKIYLFNKHTLVDIDGEWADKIVQGARKARYRGRPFRIRFDEWEERS